MTKISIIIAVYNEDKFVKKSLDKLVSIKFPIKTEFIIIDDGSTDKSLQIIKYLKFNLKKNIKIIRNKNNQGKGNAVMQGIKKASGDIITFHDADLEYNPKDLILLIRKLMELGENYVVLGTRILKREDKLLIPHHYLGNKLISFLISLFYFQKVSDVQTCYKLFYKKSLKGIKLKSQEFETELELAIKLIKKGLKIKEYPITYEPRTFEEGKKITWIDGIKSLFLILKLRLLN